MRKERLELSRVTPLEPKSSASTSSATFAFLERLRVIYKPFVTIKQNRLSQGTDCTILLFFTFEVCYRMDYGVWPLAYTFAGQMAGG